MSLYTWGSTGNGSLGNIYSHSCARVDIPRSVESQKGITFSQVSAGKTNTWALTSTGEMIVFGLPFGPCACKVADSKSFALLSCASAVPMALCVERGSLEVSWVSPEGVAPIIHCGRILRGSVVSCRDDTYGLVVASQSAEVVEIGSSSPLLRPSHLNLISPASNVFMSRLFGAAVSATTSEVRVWDHGCVIFSKPARIRVRQDVRSSTSSEWMDVADEHFLKNVSQLSLPNNQGSHGYAVERSRPHVLVRFSLGQADKAQQISTVLGESYIYMPNRLAIISLAQNDSYLFIVDSAGCLFQIPHALSDMESLSPYQILNQVKQISASNYHCAAIVDERAFVPPRMDGPSLQYACAVSIMKSKISVENVSGILISLLGRAVVDLKILLDFCYSFFSSNRMLIAHIAPEDFQNLLEDEDFVLAEARIHTDNVSFSEAIIRTRADRVRNEPLETLRSPPISRPRKKERKKISHVVTHDVEAEPQICLRIVDSQATTEDEVCIDESFVPLEDALVGSGRKESVNFRVRKWSKCNNQKVFGDPSLVSPVIAPWSPPRSVSPVVSSPVPEFTLPEARKSRSSTPSRWFKGDAGSTTPTVQDAMLEAIEEREIAEAIRLVEEFEIREKERNRSIKNHRKRNAQFNSIIARH